MFVQSLLVTRPLRGAAITAAMALGALAGCGAPTDVGSAGDVGQVGSIDQAGRSLNGRSLNGRSLNGRSLNGRSLNGRSLNGVSVTGASLGGIALGNLSVRGSALVATNADGSVVTGDGLVGAKLSAFLDDGTPLDVRIDDVYADDAPNADVQLYDVSYLDDSGVAQSICPLDTGGSEPALVTSGYWDTREGVPGGGSRIKDPSFFSFACRTATVGKCVRLGYKPWKSQNGTSLEPYLQACTRLIRADYCGDGTSWTENGRPINLYDSIGVQSDTDNWFMEAEWTESGARCLSTQRVTSLKNILGTVSACILKRENLLCGAKSHFSTGTMLMNEYQEIYIKLL